MGRPRGDGVVVGRLPPGPLNAITDVAGVRVGHVTVVGDDPAVRSGVTAIWPHDGNPFRERVYAATEPLNGYGELTGSRVVDEWGAAETMRGRDGHVLHALPVDRALALLRRPRLAQPPA